jgi:anti-anti-sigma regulatory factor
VALELWIDVGRDPVVIRLAGTLDAATGSNLVSVIQELIDGGNRRFELETSTLSVFGRAGYALVGELQRTVQASGGVLRLDGSLVARISRACDDHGPAPRSPGATMTQPAAAGR